MTEQVSHNLEKDEVEKKQKFSKELENDEELAETDDPVNSTNDTADTPEEQKTEEPTVEQLTKELAKISAEKENLYDRYLRIQAEYENYKKRSLKERSEERKYKSQDLATELLPVLDNFERALQVEPTDANKGLLEGVQMVYNQFKDALASQGIQEIPAEGEVFDPNLHHAVMQVEDESMESNAIVEELQKGYQLNDRVIRPTMVKVNK